MVCSGFHHDNAYQVTVEQTYLIIIKILMDLTYVRKQLAIPNISPKTNTAICKDIKPMTGLEKVDKHYQDILST